MKVGDLVQVKKECWCQGAFGEIDCKVEGLWKVFGSGTVLGFFKESELKYVKSRSM